MLKGSGRACACAGFSLAELMVATALGLFLMSGIVTMMFEGAKASRHALLEAQLRQSLVTAMSVISGELRRAGYWGRAGVASGAGETGAYAPLRLIAPDCLLYVYDQEGDDADGNPDAGDRHGLRLSAGALQIKTSDPTCGDTPCTTCTSGHWLALSDPQTVTITGLDFDETFHTLAFGDDGHAVVVRAFRVTLSGRLKRAPDVSHRLHAWVDVRNDEIL